MNNSLVTNFSKLLNDKENTDNTNKPKISYVYGNVRNISGDKKTVYVEIDGSTVRCPMKSNVTVAEGNRVMVMLRNHDATIVNNVSSPSTTIDFMKSDDGKEIIEEQMQDDIDALKEYIDSKIGNIFPVGSTYLTTVKVSPSTFLGGTWKLVNEGYALMSVTGDDEGGEYDSISSNTKNVSGVPAHTHSVSGSMIDTNSVSTPHIHSMHIYPTRLEGSAQGLSPGLFANYGIGTDKDGFKDRVMVWQGEGIDDFNIYVQKTSSDYHNGHNPKHSHTVDLSGMSIGTSGDGGTVNVTPKNFKVYMWYRTA